MLLWCSVRGSHSRFCLPRQRQGCMQLQSNAIKLLQLKIKQMCSKQPDWSGSVSEEASIIERKVWRECFVAAKLCLCY